MTLFRRILTYYVLTLCGSLALIGFVSWVEFGNQLEQMREGGIDPIARADGPFEEAVEIILYAGLPAIVIGVISGILLLRPALRPIRELTEALEQTDVSNLAEPVGRSGNGDELDRLTAVFNRMKQRLGLSFTQTSEFTIHASHELKTPLTVMQGTLEKMLRTKEPGTPEAECIASLLEEAQRLSVIVGQLSFLASADAGLLVAPDEPVALHELVADLAEVAVTLGAGSGIEVVLTTCQPATVRGDRMRLRQLLLILADNAVKYNQPEGTVEISLSANNGMATFLISNRAVSLPPESRARVFERFFRGDPSHSRKIEGSGLGLSIAKSIVEAHRGTIRYDEISNGQTQVSVELPIAPAIRQV